MAKIILKNIADHVGVSITTVSRVLNGQANKYRIKKETENSIIQAAKELGFNPYKSIYKSYSDTSQTIGLVVPDVSNFFLGNFARTIISQAQKFGFSIILCDSLESTQIEMESIKLLLSRNVSGLIVLPVGVESKHLVEVYQQGIPLLCADRILPSLPCSTVSVDNYSGSYEAVQYLIESGHKQIACIQRLPLAWINNERIRAYKDALKSYNLNINDKFIIGDTFGQKNGYLEVKLLLNGGAMPTAIFALSHVVALGALRAIKEEGLKVPQDISLICFDDIPFPEYFSHAITTVRQPIAEMGLIAANLLIEQIKSKNRNPVQIKLPATLIKRNSVKNLKHAVSEA